MVDEGPSDHPAAASRPFVRFTRWAGRTPARRRRVLKQALLRLPLPTQRRGQYLLAHGRFLHLRSPRRWSEKINWRMVYDRRDLIAMTCDKQASKAYVERTAAPGTVRLPRTVWCGDDPSELARVDWPPRWALKPNHGSGTVVMGTGRPDPELLGELRSAAQRWLTDGGPEQWGEWGYGQARHLVLVEEALPGTTAAGLTDYKFFVADGRIRLVQVDVDRFTCHRRRFYTADWEPLDDRCDLPLAPVVAAPANLSRMVAVATTLGAAFDFIRVDLYDTAGDVWFGELTAYSGGGLSPFDPVDLDLVLGSAWTLPRLDSSGTAAR